MLFIRKTGVKMSVFGYVFQISQNISENMCMDIEIHLLMLYFLVFQYIFLF